jgi:hypothetical protein
MATLYRAGSPSRFAFAQTHYASSSSASTVSAPANDHQHLQHLQQQMRYSAYAVEGHNVPLPPPPRTNGLMGLNGLSAPMPPPGASLGLSNSKQLYSNIKAPIYAQGITSSPLYMNPLLPKAYPPQPNEMLFVSPGVPTPVELSIYEMKQPTGLLHVTIGNQTVEFLDGVANMPQKR